MQFEVNGKSYFLAFVEDERRWFVFSQTLGGMERIPVYVDAPAVVRPEALPTTRNARN